MPASDFVATIVAGGQRYSAWKTVNVRRDYGNWQSVFQFTAAEPGPFRKGWASIRLKPGDPVQVYLGSQKVIDGSVTTRQASFDEKSHDLVIAGKSLTQKMASSAQIQPGTFNGSTFEQAARSVLGQVGVGLVMQNPPAAASRPFKSLTLQYGERIGEFVERMARMRGLFLTDDEHGRLVASQLDPGSAPVAEIEEGRNILRAVCTLDNQSAWSGLSVVGQQVGDDDAWPSRDHSASLTNPSGNGQQQIIVAEHPGDGQDFQQRVAFEMANAAWGDVSCAVTVVGWFRDDGSLWIPTENVSVLAPTLFPSVTGAVTLGIQAVTYSQDSQNGTTTTLELRKPTALTTLPSPFDGRTEFTGAAAGLVGSSVDEARVDAPDTV